MPESLNDRILIVGLLVLSVAILLVPVFCMAVRNFRRKHYGEPKRRMMVSRVLVLSGVLLLSVWCLRFAVGYYDKIVTAGAEAGMNGWEVFLSSLIHALQTFSLDADYDNYIAAGKQMISAMTGGGAIWPTIFGGYASILNVVAPIAGGAFIFEVLVGIFPHARLAFVNLTFWKEKYYFSELNKESLAMAQNILAPYSVGRVSFLVRPVLIFTDAYVNNAEEQSSELLAEARQIGAICMRDDLSHLWIPKLGRKQFLLMDAKEDENLQAYLNVVDKMSKSALKGTEIDFFTNDDAYILLEDAARNKLLKERNFEEKDLPTFVLIHSYNHLILNLLTELPLYEPLVEKRRNDDGTVDLSVTIIGTGRIGMEMFRTTYWIGQMLDCRLTINVLSKETEEEFWGKVNDINPEIRHTVKEGDPLLYYNKEKASPVYCHIWYRQCDVDTSGFIELFSDVSDGDKLLATDYFLVSLGSDEKNMTVANHLKTFVGRYHVSRASQGDVSPKAVITYVIYDAALSDMLNREKRFRYVKPEGSPAGPQELAYPCDLYMYTVGNLRDVYSIDNVFLSEEDKKAAKNLYKQYLFQKGQLSPADGDVASIYKRALSKEGRLKREQLNRERLDNRYNFMADVVRSKHRDYKAFSLGMVHRSVFNDPKMDDKAYRSEIYTEIYKNCHALLYGGVGDPPGSEQAERRKTLLNRMAWLEHRRWNAYQRICSLVHTRDYNSYWDVSGSYKFLELGLHPCIVECGTDGMASDKEKFDYLDQISDDLKEKDPSLVEVKKFDYPISDFDVHASEDKMPHKMNFIQKQFEKLRLHKMKTIAKQQIDWIKTGINLQQLRQTNLNLRRYVCFFLRYNAGECGDKCETCQYNMDKSISRGELGAVFHVSESVIFNWENGRTLISLEDLLYYCQIAKVELEDIIVFR